MDVEGFFVGFFVGALVIAGTFMSFQQSPEFDIDSAMHRIDWYLEDVEMRIPLWRQQLHNGTLTLNECLIKYEHYDSVSRSLARVMVTDVCTYRNN